MRKKVQMWKLVEKSTTLQIRRRANKRERIRSLRFKLVSRAVCSGPKVTNYNINLRIVELLTLFSNSRKNIEINQPNFPSSIFLIPAFTSPFRKVLVG